MVTPARPARRQVRAGRRNAAVMAATAATVSALFLFPTSRHHSAAAGTVAQAPADPGAAPAVSAASSSSGTVTGTVTGTAAATRFGPVQVQIVVDGGKIVSATALTYPQNNGRDRQINAYAVPILDAAALDAQSADIDTVSGATFTSFGYRQSLQAALDAAHLA